MSKSYCTSCGHPNAALANFCAACGHPLKSNLKPRTEASRRVEAHFEDEADDFEGTENDLGFSKQDFEYSVAVYTDKGIPIEEIVKQSPTGERREKVGIRAAKKHAKQFMSAASTAGQGKSTEIG